MDKLTDMGINTFYLLVLFFVWNIATFRFMWVDKNIARNSHDRRSRKSEAQIFFRALLCGSLGVALGMLPPLRHKASQLHFRIGVPMLMILNIIFFTLLHEELVEDHNFYFFYDDASLEYLIDQVYDFIASF